MNTYALCIQDSCPKAKECIRNIEYHTKYKDSENISIVNPNIAKPTIDGCDYFATAEKIKVAVGFTKLYKSLPQANAIGFWSSARFSSESAYYRAKRGEIKLPPEKYIPLLALFRKKGAPENVDFDAYEEQTRWIFTKK